MQDYQLNTMQTPEKNTYRAAKTAFERAIETQSHAVVMVRGQAACMTGFNAQLPDIVQVGGACTSPESRGRGLAKRAVALHLAGARDRGVGKATLFSANECESDLSRYGFKGNGCLHLLFFRFNANGIMMAFFRPEILQTFQKWAEPLIALLIAFAGLWMLTKYGIVMKGIGAVLVIGGLTAALAGYRRVLFQQGTRGPGVVDVTERRIAYLSPFGGGFINVEDLSRIELRRQGKARVWILQSIMEERLVIPIDAANAAALFDAFTSLPGLNPQRLTQAIQDQTTQNIEIWSRGSSFRALT